MNNAKEGNITIAFSFAATSLYGFHRKSNHISVQCKNLLPDKMMIYFFDHNGLLTIHSICPKES